MLSMLTAALELAARGWQVFPCHTMQDGCCSCGRDCGKSAGKHPRVNWREAASSDPEIIRQWWAVWPDANIGLATGPGSGIFVLDLDGPEAVAELERLEAQSGELPVTVTASTGRGSHRYFLWDPNRPVRNRAKVNGLGIDFRGEGGYVIVAPSRHQSGKRYEWQRPPEGTEVAGAPDWLFEMANGGKPPAGRTQPSTTGDLGLDLRTALGVTEGGRHDAAAKLIGADLGRGHDPVDVLDWAYLWAGRCIPPMDKEEVKRIVKDLVARDAAKLGIGLTAPSQDWPEMSEEALIGIVGDFIRQVEPHTEADRNALLVQFLTLAGTAFGRSPHYVIEATRHTTNLFSVVVGDTGDGRKGTGFERVKAVFPDDTQKRIAKGMSTGEGLIHHVRDPLYKKEATKKKGVVVDEKEVMIDDGVTDKRVLAYESEFQSVLAHTKRDANILSNVLRQAWEGGDLGTMTKHSPTKATGAHVSIIGNVTKEELVASLTAVDTANGFVNRFLWAMSRRSKLLPFGGAGVDFGDLRGRLAGALTFGETAGQVRFDDEAATLWTELYRGEFSQPRNGLFGKATSRAAPQTIRLAMVYALLDRSAVIRVEHLRAAVAVWRYCEQSARYIFGDRPADQLSDKLLTAIRQEPQSLTKLHKLFSNHFPAETIKGALQRLANQRLIVRKRVDTGGRPSEVWTPA